MPLLRDLHEDAVWIGGLRSPGRATVRGASSPRDWEVRKGALLDGAFVVYQGANIKPFQIEIAIWKFPEHLLEWEVFSKVLKKPIPGIRPVKLGIDHPLLAAPPLEITEVVILDVTQWEQDEEGGIWTCEITCLPYRAPRPVLGKPGITIPAASKPVPTAQDKAEAEIQALLAQQKALGGAIAFP